MEPFDYVERNDSGTRLAQFAMADDMYVSNTYFKKKNSRKWTWRSPNGSVKNEIDYMLTNKKSIMLNTDVTQRISIGSDHRLVGSTIKLHT